MAQGNFPRCLAVTLPHEGGWSDHKKDPGGATMKGVTLATYRQYRPGATKAQLRAITDAEVEAIYRKGYWNPVRGDQLPAGVDLATFDYGVNSGPSRAARALQASVGAAQDGAVGPKTVDASLKRDAVATVQAICARRLSFVRGLSTFSTFGKGWSRRIADVEARGVVMAGAGAAVLRAEADKAASKSSGQAKAANGAGAIGGGAGGVEAASGDVNWFLIVGLLVLAAGAMALIKSRSKINADRADAYVLAAARYSHP